eukprot:5524385-Prymnesium_polylepis.1
MRKTESVPGHHVAPCRVVSRCAVRYREVSPHGGSQPRALTGERRPAHSELHLGRCTTSSLSL